VGEGGEETYPESRDSKVDALRGAGVGWGLVEVVEVVDGADDGGDDGEEAGGFEEERGEALFEGVWGDEGT
jgi:hypothetical protein